MTVHLNSHFRLPIKWLKRASSKLNKPFCLPCKGCGSPVETSAQSAEAPTEPTGETVSATCRTQRDCERRQGNRVLAVFGAFCLLLGGSTIVQLPLTKYKIYLTFSKSTSVFSILSYFAKLPTSII